jgi:hypothetical protein
MLRFAQHDIPKLCLVMPNFSGQHPSICLVLGSPTGVPGDCRFAVAGVEFDAILVVAGDSQARLTSKLNGWKS